MRHYYVYAKIRTDYMELERVDRGLPRVEAVMLKDREIAQIFALRALGWGMRRIGREIGVARNTVRDWLRAGEDRQYGGEGRPGILDPY